MPDCNQLDVCGVRYIQGINDAAKTGQVVAVVGNDQRIIARVDVDGVVRVYQRTQDGEQIGRVLKTQLEDGGRYLTAANLFTGINRSTLQFCICFRHNFIEACGVDRSEALQAQNRQELAVSHVRRHGSFGN